MISEDGVGTRSEAGGAFPTTHWTEILSAGRNGAEEPRRALSEFCKRYWQPVYRHLRWRGWAHEDAEDLTQQFFARLVEKQTLTGVTEEGGRFRSFLLTAVGNFAANEWRKRQAAKRGGGERLEELDALDSTARASAARDDGSAPSLAFDRDWALALLERSMALLNEEYRREKKTEQFEALAPVLTGAAEKQPYRTLAEMLGTSEANVKVMVHRMRKRFGEILHEEVAGTVQSRDQIREELRYLAEIAGRSK